MTDLNLVYFNTKGQKTKDYFDNYSAAGIESDLFFPTYSNQLS